MPRELTVVEELTKRTVLASPCTVKWEEMSGDEKQRLCSQCNLSVLNAAQMTDEEVMLSIMSLASGKRVCMRIYRRTDGTILTKDCPVGVRKLQERLRKAGAWLAGGLAMLLSSSASAQTADCGDKTAKKPLWHSLITADKTAGAKTKSNAGAVESTSPLPVPHMATPGMIAAPSYSLQDTAKAEAEMRQTQNKHGADSLPVAVDAERLAMMYYWQQNYPKAQATYLQALNIYYKAGDASQVKRCHLQLAMICDVQKDTAGSAKWRKLAAEYTKAKPNSDVNLPDNHKVTP